MLQLGNCRRVLARAEGDDDCPATGVGSCEAPSAFAAHRVASEVGPLSINSIRFLDFIVVSEYYPRPFFAFPETNAISPPRPFLGERGSGGEGWSYDLQASGSVSCAYF